MRTVDLVVIVIYLALLIAIGLYCRRRAKTHKDFLVAGRHLGPWLFTGALMATTIGGSYTIGGTSFGYVMGIGGLWWVLGSGIALASMLLIARRISRLRVYTMTEIAQHRYGTVTRQSLAVIIIVALVLTLAVQVLAAGTIVATLFDIPTHWGVFIATGVMVFYSVVGGMWSITLTDIVQVFWMTLRVVFILLPFLLWKTGGWTDMWSAAPDSYKNVGAWGWGSNIIPWVVVIIAGSWTAGDYYQRLFTGKNERVVKIGLGGSAMYAAVWSVAVCTIGTAVFVLMPHLENPDNAFAKGVGLLPQGVSGVIYAAALAAVMSTASGVLIAIGGAVTNDFLGPWFKALRDPQKTTAVTVTRISMLTSAVIAVVVCLVVGDIITIYSACAIICGAAFFAPIILGLVWENRGTSIAGMSSAVVGVVVAVIVMAVHGFGAMDSVYYAIPASIATWILLALIQKPLDGVARSRWAQAFLEPEERETSDQAADAV